jgi:hypothetical protein
VPSRFVDLFGVEFCWIADRHYQAVTGGFRLRRRRWMVASMQQELFVRGIVADAQRRRIL